MSEISNPHDKFFREVFSRPDVGKDFLTNYLPSDIVAILDTESVEVTKETFIDKELREHFSDILLRLRLRYGADAYVYILLEHKSYPEHSVAFQLLRYMVRIWEQALREEKTKYLPPIVPIVIYHGKAEWKKETDFRTLFENHIGLESFIPDFRYLLYDVPRYGDEEIRGMVVLKSAMLLMKYIFKEDLAEQLPKIFGLLNKLAAKRSGLEYLETMIRYVSCGTDRLSREDLKKAVRSALSSQGGDIMPTLAQQWIEEGFQKGIQQGIQKGIQRGLKEGIREGLINGIELGLELRFGAKGLRLMPEIRNIKDNDVLKAIREGLKTTGTVEELCQIYKESKTD